MTVDELMDRIRARGGHLRLRGGRLQYRPAGVLAPDEVAWLGQHRDEVRARLARAELPRVSAIAPPTRIDVLDEQPLGEAGPGVPAWHCAIDLGSGHQMRLRADGSIFCATCHPGVDTALRSRPR